MSFQAFEWLAAWLPAVALVGAACVASCPPQHLPAPAPAHLPRLQTGQPKECELKRVRMASIRQCLGLTQGGAKALGVLAMMAGSDYDLDGAQGVGSVGGLALARHLLQGDSGDGRVLERLAALVQVGSAHGWAWGLICPLSDARCDGGKTLWWRASSWPGSAM